MKNENIQISEETLQQRLRVIIDKAKKEILAEKKDYGIPTVRLGYSGYIKAVYGENEKIEKFCRLIKEKFKNKRYSERVTYIPISAIILPEERKLKGEGYEHMDYKKTLKMCWVCTSIDYETFIDADDEEKIMLLSVCMIRSMKRIYKKTKVDWKKFQDDLLEITGYTLEQLEAVNGGEIKE
jgi:hypothetical protein